MDWTGEGYILSVKKHGETSAIIELFTRDRGRPGPAPASIPATATAADGGGGRRQRFPSFREEVQRDQRSRD